MKKREGREKRRIDVLEELVEALKEEVSIRKWTEEIEIGRELEHLGYEEEERSPSEEWYELGMREW